MTDDFDLFDSAADPDIALIAAYLSRELSIVQVVAVRNRLVADVAFRERVQPVIDGWTFPGYADASAAGTAQSRATATTTLSADEIEAGWRRHLAATDTSDAPALPSRSGDPRPLTLTRRPSMTRIAAMFALVIPPVVVSAQLVMYAAHHAEAPGHRLAQSLVSVSQRPTTAHLLVDDPGHGSVNLRELSTAASVRTAGAVLLPIRGTVTDRNHTPLANVLVAAVTLPSNETRSAVSGPNGRWVILIPVGDGRYTVSFKVAGFPDQRIELHAQASDTLLMADATLDGVGPVLSPDAPRAAVASAMVVRASRLNLPGGVGFRGRGPDSGGRIVTIPDFGGRGQPAAQVLPGAMAGAPSASPDVFAGPVDQIAHQATGNAPPDYPPALRQANIEGEVTVKFVVDTLGKADVSTFLVLRSTHPMFTAAVRQQLPNMQFVPAMVGGHPVRQFLQMPFVFTLSR